MRSSWDESVSQSGMRDSLILNCEIDLGASWANSSSEPENVKEREKWSLWHQSKDDTSRCHMINCTRESTDSTRLYRQLEDVCGIQYGDSNCKWDIHCCPIHNKRRPANLTIRFIHNHCILLVWILLQLYLFFSAFAVLACANLAIPLCTRDRVLPARRDDLPFCALQKHSLSSWRLLSAVCSSWSCVYYRRPVRHWWARAQSVDGSPFAGPNWRDDEERQGEES